MDEASPSDSAGRRRRILFALTGSVPAVLVVGAIVVWIASPRPTDLNGTVRRHAAATGAIIVPLADVAPVMREAVVATEDERFFRHHGIDLLGVARAVAYDASHLSLSEGASTITEQLGKELYLGGDDHSAWRKLQDAGLALRIEGEASKDLILQDYLSTVYFGHGSYGVDEASRRFFGEPPSRLDLARASLLAGLIQSPSGYDPYTRPEIARQRQAEVLASMVRTGSITANEGSRVLDAPLPLRGGPSLPPLGGATLSPGPMFSGPELGLGLLLLFGAVGVAVLARRPGRRPVLLKAAPAALGLVALLALARSLRVA